MIGSTFQRLATMSRLSSIASLFAGLGQQTLNDPFLAGPGRRKSTRREDGQRPGHWFGAPWHANIPRARHGASTAMRLERFGWFDSNGHPHGRSGDKLARKALRGQITKRGKATRI